MLGVIFLVKRTFPGRGPPPLPRLRLRRRLVPRHGPIYSLLGTVPGLLPMRPMFTAGGWLEYDAAMYVDSTKNKNIYIYMHIYSGCYIHIMDIYVYIFWMLYPEYGYIYIYINIYMLGFGKLGTNVANGSIRILTLDIASRIYIQIFVMWVPMLQMDPSEY
jgi:hypothetical protein